MGRITGTLVDTSGLAKVPAELLDELNEQRRTEGGRESHDDRDALTLRILRAAGKVAPAVRVGVEVVP